MLALMQNVRSIHFSQFSYAKARANKLGFTVFVCCGWVFFVCIVWFGLVVDFLLVCFRRVLCWHGERNGQVEEFVCLRKNPQQTHYI